VTINRVIDISDDDFSSMLKSLTMLGKLVVVLKWKRGGARGRGAVPRYVPVGIESI
jgi:hypothetical protein